MKKILLSCSVLLGLLSAKAQLGADYAHDDFQLDVPYGNDQGGVFWFNDENLLVEGEPSTVYLERDGGGDATLVLEQYIERDGEIVDTALWSEGKSDANPTGGTYVFGVSWGDSNGEAPGGDPFTIDISANKTMSVTVRNNFDVDVHFDFQFQDVNGTKLEVQQDTASGGWNEKEKFKCRIAAGETKECLVDLEGGWVLDYANAPLDEYDGAPNPWPCTVPSNCPMILDDVSFDFTKVTQVVMIPNAICDHTDGYGSIVGCAFGDKIELTDFKIGSVPTKAAAPTGVTATATDATHINIDWADLAEGDSVRVARSTDPMTGFKFIYAAGLDIKSDMGDGYNAEDLLTPNTTYYYYVIADNGLYSYSTLVSATTLSQGANPSQLNANEDENDDVVLTWVDNADDETGFNIYRKLGNAGTYALIGSVGTDVITYTDASSSLELNKQYTYQVKAIVAAGEELASNEAKITPVGFADDVVALKASIYPNPATSTLNFSEELEGVVIYNSNGTVMFSAAKAKNVNVAEFNKGIYFLQTSKGSKSFVVE